MKYIGFPRPSYPLAARLEPVIIGSSVFSSKKELQMRGSTKTTIIVLKTRILKIRSSTFLIFFMFSINWILAQSRKIEIPINQSKDTSYFYKIHENITSQLGIVNLIDKHDSIDFRFWRDNQLLDFKIKPSEPIMCDYYQFVRQLSKKEKDWEYKNQKLLFEKMPIDIQIARQLWRKITELHIYLFPNDSNINGWSSGRDGSTFITEYSSDLIYKYATYWTPGIQNDSITQAKKIEEFSEYLELLVGVKGRFEKFISDLPNGRYSYGMIIITKKGKKNN
jgi:hypothetical protein